MPCDKYVTEQISSRYVIVQNISKKNLKQKERERKLPTCKETAMRLTANFSSAKIDATGNGIIKKRKQCEEEKRGYKKQNFSNF